MALTILDIDGLLATYAQPLMLGAPAESAFPQLRTRDFFEPARCLKFLLSWVWLSVHKGTSVEGISKVASEVVQRGLAAYGNISGNKNRGEHDLFLLSAAITLGEPETIRQVLRRVTFADEATPPVLYSASCGILAARLLGDREMERKQFALRAGCKGGPPCYRVASRATYRAFIENNTKALVRQCHKVCEEFWTALQRQTFPDPFDRNGEVELGAWHLNAFWPWPELTLLKLSSPELELAESDDFWIPRRLLKMGWVPTANPCS